MAVSAEKLASGLQWGAIFSSKELRGRLIFTFVMLAVFRLGTYIPLPGIDIGAITAFFSTQSNNAFGMFNTLLGGALSRMSVLAIGIFPYISASIIMQILTMAIPSLKALRKEGSVGSQKINQYTRYGTLILAIVQGYLLVYGLESFSSSGYSVVMHPGYFFRITGTISITASTMFLMWIGEQLTNRGIGNGISLIVFSGIVAGLPGAIIKALTLGQTGALSAAFLAGFIIFAFLVLGFIVFMETAQRRVTIQYPKQQRGQKIYGGNTSHLPIKINTAGVIPPIFASSLLIIPSTIFNYGNGESSPYWMQMIVASLAPGRPLYMLIYAVFIIFFTFFYTSVVFDPNETADNLRQNGAIILGIRPGKETSKYFDYILTRLGVVAALYLVAVSLLPQILLVRYSLPFYFGGTSLLIVVSVSLNVFTQLQGYLYAHQYRHLLEANNTLSSSRRQGRRNRRK